MLITNMKEEFKVIANLIEENTRVLDVGCGDGTLMDYLKKVYRKNLEENFRKEKILNLALMQIFKLKVI